MKNNTHSVACPDQYLASHLLLAEDAAGKDNTIRKLHTVLKPFMLRRVKVDVEKDLPPKKETKLYIGMTAMQVNISHSILTTA